MSTPIAVQLYSLREEMEEEFELIANRVARVGYGGVETAGFPRLITPKIASRIFKELGLIVAGAHLPLPLGDDRNQVIETAIALDSEWIVSGAIDREYFQSYEKILQACDLFNEAGRIAGLGIGSGIGQDLERGVAVVPEVERGETVRGFGRFRRGEHDRDVLGPPPLGTPLP